MDPISSLCAEIGMPEEVTKILSETETGLPADKEEKLISALTDKATFKQAADELRAALPQDEGGFKKLLLMLRAALKTRGDYAKTGIRDEIFVASMQCFSRFVKEHFESYGRYGFDRDFWVGRQLSMLLFRIGELEYELSEYEGKNAVSLHIPSDAELSPDKISASLRDAKAFFSEFYPDYADAVMFCYSWLLSPALEKLLPANSKILAFYRRFEIRKWDEDTDGYKQWVFKDKTLAPERFPENTTLQRNMKKYVLSGGKVGEAWGILKS